MFVILNLLEAANDTLIVPSDSDAEEIKPSPKFKTIQEQLQLMDYESAKYAADPLRANSVRQKAEYIRSMGLRLTNLNESTYEDS